LPALTHLAGLGFAAVTRDDLPSGLQATAERPSLIACVSSDTVLRVERHRELMSLLRHASIVLACDTRIVSLSRLVGRPLPAVIELKDVLNTVHPPPGSSTHKVAVIGGGAWPEQMNKLLQARSPHLGVAYAGAIPHAATGIEAQISQATVLIAILGDAQVEHWLVDNLPRFPAKLCLAIDPFVLIEAARSADAARPAPSPAWDSCRHAARVFRLLVLDWLYAVGFRHDEIHELHASPDLNVPAADSRAPVPRIPSPPLRRSRIPLGTHLKQTIGLVLVDAMSLAAAFLVCDLLRCRFWQHTPWPQPPIAAYHGPFWYLWVVPVLLLVWPMMVGAMGFYQSTVPPRTWRWRRLSVASVLFLWFFSSLALFFSRLEYPRMQILLTAVAAPVAFLLGRFGVEGIGRIRRWFNDQALPNYDLY